MSVIVFLLRGLTLHIAKLNSISNLLFANAETLSAHGYENSSVRSAEARNRPTQSEKLRRPARPGRFLFVPEPQWAPGLGEKTALNLEKKIGLAPGVLVNPGGYDSNVMEGEFTRQDVVRNQLPAYQANATKRFAQGDSSH